MKKIVFQNRTEKGEESYDLVSEQRDVEYLLRCYPPGTWNFSAPVYMVQLVEELLRGEQWFKYVKYPQFAIELILKGKMVFSTEEHASVAGPGTLYLIPPRCVVRCSCPAGKKERKLWSIFSGENLKSILLTLQMSNCRLVHLADPEETERKIRSLAEIAKGTRIENPIRSFAFPVELSESTGGEFGKKIALQRAVKILDNNFCEDLQIPAVAASADVSESTLRWMFKAGLHCSPLEYLNMLRLKFAAGKLLRTSLPVKEIAQRSSFFSASRFCMAFQSRYHASPNIYRKQHKEQ